MNKEIPVFIFNGFLDSGKTTLIKEIISGDARYQNSGTLIITFEEGEEEYDSTWLKEMNVELVVVTDEMLEDETFFYEVLKEHNPDKIIFEFTISSIITFNLAQIIYIAFIVFNCILKNKEVSLRREFYGR